MKKGLLIFLCILGFIILCIIVVGVFSFNFRTDLNLPLTIAEISDEKLLMYANEDFDKAEMWGKTIGLGLHEGKTVVMKHPCGDICPDYTVRIIYYEGISLDECESNGGSLKNHYVADGPSTKEEFYCVPKILASDI